MSALLEACSLSTGYGKVDAIHDLEFSVGEGEILALLGANGAGKTTTVLALAGALPPRTGEVRFLGATASGPLNKRARMGLSVVPDQHAIYSRLTTRQNLALGRNADIDQAISIFPELEPLLSRRGGLLSGGEKQMLAMARALARPTKVLVADEVTLGLAPMLATRVLSAVRHAADQGLGAILVEQHVNRVLDVADRVCVLRQGRIAFSGTAGEARNKLDEITKLYLGRKDADDKPSDLPKN